MVGEVVVSAYQTMIDQETEKSWPLGYPYIQAKGNSLKFHNHQNSKSSWDVKAQIQTL